MADLLCNISDNLIRKISDAEIVIESPIDEVWKVVAYPYKTKSEIENETTIEMMPISGQFGQMKWKNNQDNKWYRLKIRPDFSRRYLPDIDGIETVIDKIAENLSEEII